MGRSPWVGEPPTPGGARKIDNCNTATTTGFWSADITTLNTPDTASYWVGQSIWYSIDTTTGLFVAQIAYEIEPTYRMFRRTLNVSTWTAWVQVT